MKRQAAEDKAANLVELTRLGCTVTQAIALQRLARSLHRLYEIDCNDGLTKQQELRLERLENRVEAVAKDAGLYSYHQRDPRGWPIVVDKAPITESSTWGKIRVCPY